LRDRAVEFELIDDFVKLGVTSWTSDYCNGRGEHTTLGGPRSRVRIEILTSLQVAEGIIHRLEDPPYNSHGVVAYMDSVKVSGRRKFS
jgi:hypothetical protein